MYYTESLDIYYLYHEHFYKVVYYYKKNSMNRSNGLKYFIYLFYRGSMVLYLGVVYKYKSILVILIHVILLINMKFAVKYH
jgi:hypothetical protein